MIRTFACAKCGRIHSGLCPDGFTGCFNCGKNNHFMRECPMNKQVIGNGGNRSQSSLVAPPDRVAPREATFGTRGGVSHLYDITSRQGQEDSPNVFTSMI